MNSILNRYKLKEEAPGTLTSTPPAPDFPTYLVDERKRFLVNEQRLILQKAAKALKDIDELPEEEFDSRVSEGLWYASTALSRLVSLYPEK